MDWLRSDQHVHCARATVAFCIYVTEMSFLLQQSCVNLRPSRWKIIYQRKNYSIIFTLPHNYVNKLVFYFREENIYYPIQLEQKYSSNAPVCPG